MIFDWYFVNLQTKYYIMAKLIQFSVGNFRSFKDERTFTFVPKQIQDEPKGSVACIGKQKISTISAIYGANSSGKSNLTYAIATMGYIVEQSVRLNDDDELAYDPFMLYASNDVNKPMHFEIVYLTEGQQRIRYGFENNSHTIVKEWLFVKEPSKEEKILFIREEDGIAVNGELFQEGIDREEMTNDNRLFLSLVAQVGGEFSKSILSFFHSDCNVLSGLDTRGYANYTKRQFKSHDKISENAMSFFKRLQLGFTEIDVEEQEVDISRMPSEIRPKKQPTKLEVYSSHNIYNPDGTISGLHKFHFGEHESSGTKKIFELAGPIFDTLSRGSILVIDELDAKMHPLISQQIVRLFTSEDTNPLHAQLLFTTHDTNLLSAKLMRRDQIWFSEKDRFESTDLYRLSDIVLPDGTRPRGDGNIEKNYINGRYGAIPFINNIFD